MLRGGFKIFKSDFNKLQISDASSILISKERYQPVGSTFFLGYVSGGDDGTEQELRISSREYMTEMQLIAEQNSIEYAEEFIEESPEEVLINRSVSETSEQTRIAPYEAFYIKGLGADFEVKWNENARLRDYIYLELDLWRNLDIRSAQIVVGPVGGNGEGRIPGQTVITNGETNDRIDFIKGEKGILGWPSFPSPYLFSLELNAQGDLIDVLTFQKAEFGEERFQKKAYILIGYLSKDPLVLKNSIVINDDQGNRFGVVSCLNSDLAVQHGLSNETPVLNLIPSWGAAQTSSNYFDSLLGSGGSEKGEHSGSLKPSGGIRGSGGLESSGGL